MILHDITTIYSHSYLDFNRKLHVVIRQELSCPRRGPCAVAEHGGELRPLKRENDEPMDLPVFSYPLVNVYITMENHHF